MFYFCYSSALDREATALWARDHGYPDFSLTSGQKARLAGFSLVADWPSNYWGGRVLSLRLDPGSSVEGILFELPDAWQQAVRHKEGVVTGVALEMESAVQLNSVNSSGESASVVAKVYVVHPQRKSLVGPKSERYFKILESAYRMWGLSTEALSSLT